MKKYTRYLVFIIGILVLTFGVAIQSKSGLGVGPWDALNFGLSEKFGLTTGQWMWILSAVALILSAVIKKGLPNILTFITVLLVGGCIDFWVLVVLKNVQFEGTVLRYSMYCLGTVICAFGVAMYLLPRLPQNPIDYLMVTIQDKFNMKVMYAKLLIDITCFVIAFILKGPIGVGTILALVLVGPLVGIFEKMIMPTYENLTGEDDKDVKQVLDMEVNV